MKNLSILLLIAFYSFSSMAQTAKPAGTTTNDFVAECMRNSEDGGRKQMVMWLPTAFWEIVAQQMNAAPEAMEMIVQEMDQYHMFGVVDYGSPSTGVMDFASEEELRKSIKYIDSSKTIFLPLKNDEITPKARQLVQTMEPMLKQVLGQFGGGMRIFLFRAKKVNGMNAMDVRAKNSFRLSWGQTNLLWSLPLASLMPPKYCPVDKEKMKGNWSFCPFHGTKLD